jgi:hypothetical protein
MLVARASSELGRLIGADALLGIPYTAEELEDELVGVLVPATPPQAWQPPQPAAPPPSAGRLPESVTGGAATDPAAGTRP